MHHRILQNVFLLLILFLAACAGKKPSGPPTPPPVAIAVKEVKAEDVVYFDEYPAILKAINEVELRPQVNGYITGIHFEEGTRVKKGQKLYSIDQQSYEAAYQQALANLQVQEANLVKAQQDMNRYKELDKNDAVAKQQVDYAVASYKSAEEQVNAAKAGVRSVQTNVRYSTITAPFDGRIGLSQVRLGGSVSAGQTLLNSISADDPMAADITVDQREIMRFTNLVKVSQKDSVFRLAIGGQLYPGLGKIAVIDRAVDPQTGSIKMRLTFPNVDFALRSGMSAVVKVKATGKGKSIIIPIKAITEQLGEYFVYTIVDGKASQKKVKLAQQIGTNIIVREGLSEGEQVATEGVQNLREGSAVTIPAITEKK